MGILLRKLFMALVAFVACGLVVWNLIASNVSQTNLREYASNYVKSRIVRNYQTVNFSSSGKFPSELDIENIYWQVLNTSDGDFKMVNAYYDNRKFLKYQHLIRILAYVNRIDPKIRTFCQLWFEGLSDKPVVIESNYILAWQRSSGLNPPPGSQPYLVNCLNPLASHGLVPTSVSLVENKNDDASNNLKVINNVPIDGKKKLVAVCTKDLEYPNTDLSHRLIEWVEIVHLLGADKIFMYVVKVHPNMMKALKYFEAQGILKIEMVTVPTGLPGKHGTRLQAFQQEMLSLNDCLYKHMNEYEYVLPIDIDEFIVPNRKEDKTWLDLITRVKKNSKIDNFCSFYASNVFFLSNNKHENETQSKVPTDMYFLQQVHRAKTYSKPPKASKSFQSTDNVILVRNHLPYLCVQGAKHQSIQRNDGKLHHYKNGCGACSSFESEDYKKNTVKDLSLWKYKDELIVNVNKALQNISFE